MCFLSMVSKVCGCSGSLGFKLNVLTLWPMGLWPMPYILQHLETPGFEMNVAFGKLCMNSFLRMSSAKQS